MNVDELKRNLRNVIERYRNKEEFTGEVCRDVMARDCLSAIEELEAALQNERDFGQHIARCADHDIAKLEAENARLHQANFDCNAHFNTLKEDYEELKKQVPV